MTMEVTRPGSGAALADPQRPVRGGMFAACRAPGYTYVLVAGWFWTMGRWGCSFLGAYLANTMSGSARLVQLTGVALWAPLLVGGVLGGVISDRLDRRRTVITQFVVLIPLAVAMGLAGQTDRIELWMVYVFQVVVGVGWVIDMTSRRAIIYDLVGPTRLDNAMALESLSSASGLALGALVGGTIIQAVGTGAAYLCHRRAADRCRCCCSCRSPGWRPARCPVGSRGWWPCGPGSACCAPSGRWSACSASPRR